MKNRSLFVLLLAIGVSIGLASLAHADFFSSTTNSDLQPSQGDLADDVTSLFDVDPENGRNSADVYNFCTEGTQEGAFQEDPRTIKEYPVEDAVFTPGMAGVVAARMFSDIPPQQDYPPTPPTPPPPPPPPPPTPEPATMLILGLGAAGLLPLSYRRFRRS